MEKPGGFIGKKELNQAFDLECQDDDIPLLTLSNELIEKAPALGMCLVLEWNGSLEKPTFQWCLKSREVLPNSTNKTFEEQTYSWMRDSNGQHIVVGGFGRRGHCEKTCASGYRDETLGVVFCRHLPLSKD